MREREREREREGGEVERDRETEPALQGTKLFVYTRHSLYHAHILVKTISLHTSKKEHAVLLHYV